MNLPLRPLLNSKQFRSLNGYRAERGDFETELNDTFEAKYIADFDLSESDATAAKKSDKDNKEEAQFEFDITVAILKVYNQLIAERYERKRFIRQFGLLNEVSNAQLDGFAFLQPKTPAFLPPKFQRFFADLDSYIAYNELRSHQLHLVGKLAELNEYRQCGLRSLSHVAAFKASRLKRLNRTRTVHMASLLTSIHADSSTQQAYAQCQEWFKRFVMFEKKASQDTASGGGGDSGPTVDSTSNGRVSYKVHLKYKNNPLKIENYPDWDKLDESEKEFCRVARFQPVVFLRVKTVLLMENSKNGCCSYSRARKIAGIDVNKTRLIHNLLIKANLIKANPT